MRAIEETPSAQIPRRMTDEQFLALPLETQALAVDLAVICLEVERDRRLDAEEQAKAGLPGQAA